MDLTINAGRPHTGTSRCCPQVMYSGHVYAPHSDEEFQIRTLKPLRSIVPHGARCLFL
jgi:hypothetical protein